MRAKRLLIVSAVLMACGRSANADLPRPVRPPGPAPGGRGAFVPNAGYLRTAKQLYLERQTAKTTGRPPVAAPRAVPALSGVRSIPVICLEYKNIAAPFAAAAYQAKLFDPGQPIDPPPSPRLPTLTQYYRDISNGRLTVTGRVLGFYKLPKDDTFYENNDNGAGVPFGQMLQFGLDKADAEVDFGLFDNDGSDGIPNSGDDDGKVDTVFFIHPEAGAECDGTAKNNVWSHSWHYSEPTYGHNGPYVTMDVRRDAAGAPRLNPDGTPQRIVGEDYTIQPGLDCATGSGGIKKIIEVGVFCHEYGHALGLPDLYDRTPSNGPDSEGVGNLCLMAGGSYGGDGRHPESPALMSAWSKAFLGWAQIQRITSNQTVAFEPVADRNVVYCFDVPNTNGKEYFLIEYRDKDWTDLTSSKLGWDRFLPVSGLAVWHCDDRVGAGPKWPFSDFDQGQNDSPSLPGTPSPSFRPKHSLVTLMQFDRKLDLERGQNRGDAGDLLPTSGSFIDDTSCVCGTRSFSGKATGFSLKLVNLATGTLVARVDDLPGGGEAIVTTRQLAGPTLQELASVVQEADAATHEKLGRIAASLRRRVAEATDAPGLLVPPSPQAVADALRDLVQDDARFLQGLDSETIRRSVRQETQLVVQRAAAALRTEKVAADYAADSPITKAVKKLVDASRGTDRAAEVRYAPSRSRVERLVGLSIPVEGGDAMNKLRDDLRPLIGDQVRLELLKGDAQAPRRFAQVVEVRGKSLPIFGKEVELFYKDEVLTAFTSNVVPPDKLKVEGDPGARSPDDAKAVAIEKAGVDRDAIRNVTEGVYLSGDDPGQGRVAYRVDVRVGPGQDDIHVFVDEATREVLQIR